MVLYECACANFVSKANFNLINRTDLFFCLHIMFQISCQNSKGQKSYCKFLGVRSELLRGIYECKALWVSRFCRPVNLSTRVDRLIGRQANK